MAIYEPVPDAELAHEAALLTPEQRAALDAADYARAAYDARAEVADAAAEALASNSCLRHPFDGCQCADQGIPAAEPLFSDEAAMCAECAAEAFEMTEWDTIRGPGKFEGEPLCTYHAYHVVLDGCSDDSGDDWDRVGNVLLVYSGQGFVSGEVCASEAEAKNMAQAWHADETTEEEE